MLLKLKWEYSAASQVHVEGVSFKFWSVKILEILIKGQNLD